MRLILKSAVIKISLMIILIILLVLILFHIHPLQLKFNPTLLGIQLSKNQILGAKSERRFVALTKNNHTFVYSAYWDQSGHVRIFLLRKYNAFPRIYCALTKQIRETGILSSTSWMPTDNCRGRKFKISNLLQYYEFYIGSFVCCTVDSNVHQANLFNSISLFVHGESHQVTIPIGNKRLNKQLQQNPNEFGLCVAPWHESHRYKVNFLAEYVELHRLMGVRSIRIYMMDKPTTPVRQLLANLAHSSSLNFKIIPWNIPIPHPDKQLLYYAQILAYNDCLYRLSTHSKHLVFMDFDEILVPYGQSPSNWSVITEQFDNGQLARYHTVCFPMVYFPPWGNETSYYDRIYATSQSFQQRRKCMIKSAQVSEMGVHEPMDPLEWGWGSEYALVFHFRKCVLEWNQNCPDRLTYVRNEVLKVYRQMVKKQVESLLKGVRNT